LSERLKRGALIFDGAIGTELYRRHVFVNASFEGLNLTQPDLVREVHHAYAEAGAEVMTANSYGANANKLSGFGLGEKMAEINRAAVALARECGGADRLVAGSIGPFGDRPFGHERTDAEQVGTLADQARALAGAGADFLLFETLSSSDEVRRACSAAAETVAPFVISVAVDRNGETIRGESLESLLAEIDRARRAPAAVGLNCGSGPESMLSALEKLVRLTDLPIIVQPNAGQPRPVDGRMIYMTSPEYLATYARRYIDLGARGVGGCCGTGPEHIRDIARGIRPLHVRPRAGRIERAAGAAPLGVRPPMAGKSNLAAKLAARAWVITVEITPPRGWDLQATLDRARQCRDAGVDAINIPDGPRASARLSPLVTAERIQREAGIEAVLHFCCRDKSLLGMQADLLGCAAAGIRNLLFITGDPPKLGDFPFSSAVFDADSIEMARVQDHMNRGADLGQKSLQPPTNALIGVGADPNALDQERELRRTREKIEAGAEFIITQPVFDLQPLTEFLEAIADLKTPVIAGIWPLASYRNAEFMRNEVPGVTVPDEVMRRMAAAKTKEDQRREGVAIARESVAALRSVVAGVQVSAPFGNVLTALEVLAR
jgi:homocysteine S-methyltransferase